MTRLELSICEDAITKFNPMLPSIKTAWSNKIQAAMLLITQRVLNAPSVLEIAYRKLSLPVLLGYLSKSQVNLLAIGRYNCWLLSARTSHRNHYIGTR